MNKIPVRVKVKLGLASSATKKRFDLDNNGNMVKMENQIFEVDHWDEKTNLFVYNHLMIIDYHIHLMSEM